MKKSLLRLLTVCVLLSVSSAMAQDNQANKISVGLSVTPLGTQRVGPLKILDGGGSYDSKRLFGPLQDLNERTFKALSMIKRRICLS